MTLALAPSLLLLLLLLPGPTGANPSTSISAPLSGVPRAPGSTPVPSQGSPAGWSNVTGTGDPPPRCCSIMAYDARDGYTVLFGGLGTSCPSGCNQTWVETSTGWSEVHTRRSPPARGWGSMAYDPFDGYVLLFGGLSPNGSAALSDTWAYSNGSWTRINAPNGPGPRWSAGLSADLEDGYMLLFGGYSPSAGFLGDTWSFVGGVWTELSPAVSPAPRWTPALAFDPEEAGVLLFGGFSPTLGFLGDTWLFAQGNWRELYPASSPPAREKAMMDYDAVDQAVTLFGGDSCPLGCSTGAPVRVWNDTWTFQNGNWTNVTAVPEPPAQCCGAMAYAWNTGALVLVGDAPTEGSEAGVWSYAPAVPDADRAAILGLESFPLEATTTTVTTLLVEARPSSGALSYSYRGLPAGCSPSDTAVLSCLVLIPGTYTVMVEVEDTTGRTANATLVLKVVQGPPPPSLASSSGGPPWLLVGTTLIVLLLLIAFLWEFRKGGRGGAGPASPPALAAAPPTSKVSEKVPSP